MSIISFEQAPGQAFHAFFSQRRFSKILVITDENTGRHCYPLVQNLIPDHHLVEIKSGEENKNLSTCEQIWQAMTDAGMDRKSLVVNLGGGVIGDMGGFCAATYKRGVAFVQVPTTLLSMVDASVGGKLGIDFNGYKNHIGVFKLPEAVMICTDFLNTLDAREFRSGYAEVMKHALIADADKWKELAQMKELTLDRQAVVKHSVAIKSRVVEADPEEAGLRKILNFGHTLGHAVETCYLTVPGKRLLHGEAISVGFVMEAYLSHIKGYISKQDLESITHHVLTVFGKFEILPSDFDTILHHTLQDKKNNSGEVRFALLQKIGEANYDIPCGKEEMEAAMNYYIGLAA